MPLKTVIFDMGNVLIHFSHVKACVQLARLAEISADKVREVLFDSGLETEYEAGLVSTEEVHSRLEMAFGKKMDSEKVLNAVCDIFWPKPDMENLLKRVKRSGVRTVLLSNVNEAHFDYIKLRYQFLDDIDHQILSYKIGGCKPEKKIYEYALAVAQADSSECLFIDDVPENVAASEAAGLPAHLFKTAAGVEHELIERGLALLP